MDGGCLADATNKDCHSAFLRRLLPRLEDLSPLMLVPDWPVAGAMPA